MTRVSSVRPSPHPRADPRRRSAQTPAGLGARGPPKNPSQGASPPGLRIACRDVLDPRGSQNQETPRDSGGSAHLNASTDNGRGSWTRNGTTPNPYFYFRTLSLHHLAEGPVLQLSRRHLVLFRTGCKTRSVISRCRIGFFCCKKNLDVQNGWSLSVLICYHY